jgi:hypothetical protein
VGDVAPARTPREKAVVTIALAALVWVVGATLFYRSGGINGSGFLPTAGCSIALWAALRSDTGLLWFGTAIVALSAVVLVFSVGLVVVPAAIGLVLGSIVLGRSRQHA